MPRMHPQLDAILGEYDDAERRFSALRSQIAPHDWHTRPGPDSWSVAECVAHLNLTSAAYEQDVERGLESARSLDRPAPRRYRRNVAGWLLWRTMGPPVRLRMKTTAAFVPASDRAPDVLLAEWNAWHRTQRDWVRRSDGLPIDAVKIPSPFEARIQYNLFAALSILPRHQLRHIWQAERAWHATRGRAVAARSEVST